MRGDFAMEFHRHMELAEALEWIIEVNFATIYIKALRLECARDIGRSNRSEKVLLLADLTLEGELHVIELLRKRFRAGLFLRRFANGSGLHLLDDGFVGAACFNRKLAR